MGSPGAELPRGTTRPACGVAQTVPLGHSHAMFRPRPICGSGFYAVLLIPATFNVSRLYEHRGEYLSPLGLKTSVKGNTRIKNKKIVWLTTKLVRLPAELVRLLAELVRLLTDSPFDRCYSE